MRRSSRRRVFERLVQRAYGTLSMRSRADFLKRRFTTASLARFLGIGSWEAMRDYVGEGLFAWRGTRLAFVSVSLASDGSVLEDVSRPLSRRAIGEQFGNVERLSVDLNLPNGGIQPIAVGATAKSLESGVSAGGQNSVAIEPDNRCEDTEAISPLALHLANGTVGSRVGRMLKKPSVRSLVAASLLFGTTLAAFGAAIPEPLMKAVDSIAGKVFGPCCGAGNDCSDGPLECKQVGSNQNSACDQHDRELAAAGKSWNNRCDPEVRDIHGRLSQNSDSTVMKGLFNKLSQRPDNCPESVTDRKIADNQAIQDAERAERQKAAERQGDITDARQRDREAVQKSERAERQKAAERQGDITDARQRDREAVQKSERDAAEKSQRDAAERSQREAAAEKSRRDAADKAQRDATEKAQRDAADKATRDASEKAKRDAAEKAQRDAARDRGGRDGGGRGGRGDGDRNDGRGRSEQGRGGRQVEF